MHLFETVLYRLADDAGETPRGLWIESFAGFAWLSGNLALTILKENALFWRDAGGYALALREFTLHFYYPTLTGSFAICCALSWRLLRRYSIRFRCSMFSLCLVLLLWCLLLLNCGLLVGDNIDNLVEGRPLHSHRADL